MKILFVSTLYYPYAVGGAEATVKLLAEGVVRAGDEAVVVTLTPEGHQREETREGVRIHYIPLFNVFFPHGPGKRPFWKKPIWQAIDAYNPVMARRIAAVVAREAPDVINIHNLQGFSAAVWGSDAVRQVPVVQTVHDHYSVCANSTMFRNGRNCRTRCLRCRVFCAPRVQLSRNVDVMTAVSRRLQERILGYGAFEGVADLRIVPGSNSAPPAMRPRDRTGATSLVLGFLGRLEPIKGLEILLGAARRFDPATLNVKVGGIGAPDYEARLRAQFAGPGIDFEGRVDPAAFFSQIDALVVPSIVEDSLPRVVHEALGHGVPVVGSRIGGIPEMINDGETGYLVPPGDEQALAQVIAMFLENPPNWEAMGASCVREADRYTFERVFQAYRDAWNAAIASGQPGCAAGPGDGLDP